MHRWLRAPRELSFGRRRRSTARQHSSERAVSVPFVCAQANAQRTADNPEDVGQRAPQGVVRRDRGQKQIQRCDGHDDGSQREELGSCCGFFAPKRAPIWPLTQAMTTAKTKRRALRSAWGATGFTFCCVAAQGRVLSLRSGALSSDRAHRGLRRESQAPPCCLCRVHARGCRWRA